MVTPGTADAASDARGDRGRSRYRFRLKSPLVPQYYVLSDIKYTHAVRHPKTPNDHSTMYHVRPITERTVTTCCFVEALSVSVIIVLKGLTCLFHTYVTRQFGNKNDIRFIDFLLPTLPDETILLYFSMPSP
jgi:hypothetical protein